MSASPYGVPTTSSRSAGSSSLTDPPATGWAPSAARLNATGPVSPRKLTMSRPPAAGSSTTSLPGAGPANTYSSPPAPPARESSPSPPSSRSVPAPPRGGFFPPPAAGGARPAEAAGVDQVVPRPAGQHRLLDLGQVVVPAAAGDGHVQGRVGQDHVGVGLF